METRGPEDIRALNPAVPDTLKRVITKSVAFDPAERYRDAADLSAAIFEAVPALSGAPPARETSAPEALISEPSTAPTVGSTQTVPADVSLHPDLLREIERDLATFIGPMASIALKRAVSQTNDILALYDLLGGQVNSPRDRAEFLARGRQRAVSGRGGLPSSAPPKSGLVTERRPDNPTVPPSVANIRAIEADLTRYIGPIAKILVKRELGKFQTLAKFCHVLSAHIPDERDRRAFLNAHGGD
jgi:serine/threonine-protein kinase